MWQMIQGALVFVIGVFLVDIIATAIADRIERHTPRDLDN